MATSHPHADLSLDTPTGSHGAERRRSVTRRGVILSALPLALAACSTGGSGEKKTPTASADDAKALFTVEDAWAKSAKKGEMTAVFGTLTNTSDKPLHLTGASTDAAASVQLHESTSSADGGMSMKEVKEGFTVEPGKKLELVPGGLHIMLMDLTRTLDPGATITVTLQVEGQKPFMIDATVRDYSGAKESYGPSDDGGDHADHGHKH